MSGKKFFDTNILAYAVDANDDQKTSRSQQLIRQAVLQQDGVISYQILQEFLNVGFRKFKPPLTVDRATIYLAGWLENFQVVPWDPALMGHALRIKDRYGFQWFDSLWIAAASKAECRILYAEDLQHGQQVEGMTITNPFI